MSLTPNSRTNGWRSPSWQNAGPENGKKSWKVYDRRILVLTIGKPGTYHTKLVFSVVVQSSVPCEILRENELA